MLQSFFKFERERERERERGRRERERHRQTDRQTEIYFPYGLITLRPLSYN